MRVEVLSGLERRRCPLPRRRPGLSYEQRRRTSVAGCGGRKKKRDLRRFRCAGGHRAAAVYTLIETCSAISWQRAK
jgi:hypothetical protein